mgnify:CR=1 FL=1
MSVPSYTVSGECSGTNQSTNQSGPDLYVTSHSIVASPLTVTTISPSDIRLQPANSSSESHSVGIVPVFFLTMYILWRIRSPPLFFFYICFRVEFTTINIRNRIRNWFLFNFHNSKLSFFSRTFRRRRIVINDEKNHFNRISGG